MISQLITIDDGVEEQIAALGEKFYKVSGLCGEFRSKTFIETWNMLLKTGIASAWVAESGDRIVGILGVILAPGLFDGKVTVQECFWFVDKEYRGLTGVRLLSTMLEWAENLSVERILIAHIDHVGDLTKLFERNRFKKLETVFMRETPW